jgi:carotenoid cleavage dioxygenase-like enzyme
MDVDLVGRALTTLPADDDHPYRTGAWRPQSTEWLADELVVEGDLPDDLDGMYLRNTENPVHPSIGRYHPFEGDGMIHAVAFRGGKVYYRNKFVRTDAFVAEQQAERSLWVGLAERPDKALRMDGWGARGHLKDASSTDVVVHNGLVLSSFYECGDLYQLDPFTLDDRGKATWKGEFPSDRGVSAHPKVDDRTGEMLFFNYNRKDPYLHYGIVDAEDTLVHYVGIDLPGARIPHDMAFTENYAIFNDLPMFWDPTLMESGVFLPKFHPDLPSRLGVLPRRGTPDQIRWFEFDPTYVLHWTNAYEVGEEIVVEGFFQHCPEPWVPADAGYYERMSRFISLDGMQTKLHRWRMNLVTGESSEEQLSDSVTEFGMINAGHATRAHRYTYAATGVPGKFLFNGLTKHDTTTGTEEHFAFPEGVFGSETAMAPRAHATAEDDGYLITLTSDVVNDVSECVVFDAARLADGPLCRIRLPERISSGTHATWAHGSEIPGW